MNKKTFLDILNSWLSPHVPINFFFFLERPQFNQPRDNLGEQNRITWLISHLTWPWLLFLCYTCACAQKHINCQLKKSTSIPTTCQCTLYNSSESVSFVRWLASFSTWDIPKWEKLFSQNWMIFTFAENSSKYNWWKKVLDTIKFKFEI